MIHRRRVPVSPLPVRVFLYESDNAPTDCDLHLHGLQNVRVIFYFFREAPNRSCAYADICRYGLV